MANVLWSSSALKVLKRLDWLLDHNQEDRRVTVGCKTCGSKETKNLLAATARTAWLVEFHQGHEVWMKNPFRKKE